jgi:hypothetical protein
MKPTYCWRCQMVIPMLDESEWAEMEPLLCSHITEIKSLRAAEGLSLAEARMKVSKHACERYRKITGFEESNAEAIWHHRRALYGCDCPKCGKPFRTPAAHYCVECGFKNKERTQHWGQAKKRTS